MFSRDELSKMQLEALQSMHTLIVSVIEEKEAAKHAAFMEKVKRDAAKHGIDLTALLKKSTGKTVAPKYRNPANPAQTWSGRGIEPRWMAALKGDARKAAEIAPPAGEAVAAPAEQSKAA